MNRSEVAIYNHGRGFNCCSAQLFAWQDKINLDENTILSLTAGLGGGLRTGEVCGAIIGATMVLGFFFPYNTSTGPEGKVINTKITQEFQKRFVERTGYKCCRDLKPSNLNYTSPTITSSGAKTNCEKLIALAVEITEDILRENNIDF